MKINNLLALSFLIAHSALAQNEIALRPASKLCDNLLVAFEIAGESQDELKATLARLLGVDYPILKSRGFKKFLAERFSDAANVNGAGQYSDLKSYANSAQSKFTDRRVELYESFRKKIISDIENYNYSNYGIKLSHKSDLLEVFKIIDSHEGAKKALRDLIEELAIHETPKLKTKLLIKNHNPINNFRYTWSKADEISFYIIAPELSGFFYSIASPVLLPFLPSTWCSLGNCIKLGYQKITNPNRVIENILEKNKALLIKGPGDANQALQIVNSSFAEVETLFKKVPNISELDTPESLTHYAQNFQKGAHLFSMLSVADYDHFVQNLNWKGFMNYLKLPDRPNKLLALGSLKAGIERFRSSLEKQTWLIALADQTSTLMQEQLTAKKTTLEQATPSPTNIAIIKMIQKQSERVIAETDTLAITMTSIDLWLKRIESAYQMLLELEIQAKSNADFSISDRDVKAKLEKIKVDLDIQK